MNKNGLLTEKQANRDTSMQTASERGRQSDESEIGRQAGSQLGGERSWQPERMDMGRQILSGDIEQVVRDIHEREEEIEIRNKNGNRV